MLLFTAEGPRSIDERDVIAVYRDSSVGAYCNVTVIMLGGEEISGRAVAALISTLDDEHPLPPLTA
jgi:hypothetical protein